MADIKTRPAGPLIAELKIPGDVQICQRALVLAAMSNGPCTLPGFIDCQETRRTITALRQLGVDIQQVSETRMTVSGVGQKFTRSTKEIDCRDSPTTLALMTALAATLPFKTVLWVDETLSVRPWRRILEPLRRLGCDVQGKGENEEFPPFVVNGGHLKAGEVRNPHLTSEIKDVALIAAIRGKGISRVHEIHPTVSHTETLLRYLCATVWQEDEDKTVCTCGGQTLESRDIPIPGDLSNAAVWLATAALRAESHLIIDNVGMNPTRAGILSVLIRMGANLREVFNERGPVEKMGRVEVHGGTLRGTTVLGREVPTLLPEIPIIAVAGALAEGRTLIRDANDLRRFPRDRLSLTVKNLRAMGVNVKERDDGMEIIGGKPLRGARLESGGDPRVAIAFAMAGLFAEAECTIRDTECIDTIYPDFEKTLDYVMSVRHSGNSRIPVISSAGAFQE